MDPLKIKSRDEVNNESTHAGTMGPSLEERQLDGGEEIQENSFIGEIFKFAVLALIIVIPFRLFIAQPFIVSGASMSPTFETGQYLIVDQVSYYFEEPQRGDVVIFRYPNDHSKYFIKRIVGLPGEVVQLENGNTTIIEPGTNVESVLNEEYLVTDKTDDHLTITLSSNEFFVMGDNRGASSDSRMWGPIKRDEIVGRALMRLLPISDASLFPGAYSFTQFETGIGSMYVVD